MKSSCEPPAVRVAIVGDFQIGKSSLVNSLLAESLAETGEGFSPTTDAVSEYTFAPGICLVDTPGFNDKRPELTRLSEDEIQKADAVVFVQTDKVLESRKVDLLHAAERKPVVVLYNCWHTTHGQLGWILDAKVNVDACSKIRSQLASGGMESSLLPINGKSVVPVNVLWAQFGLGQPINGDQGDQDIADFASRKLGIVSTGDALRAEMLKRSGFLPVRDFLKNLPLELLKHAVTHPEQEINRIVDSFAAELKKRWSAA